MDEKTGTRIDLDLNFKLRVWETGQPLRLSASSAKGTSSHSVAVLAARRTGKLFPRISLGLNQVLAP
jgi:hypothetical protein